MPQPLKIKKTIDMQAIASNVKYKKINHKDGLVSIIDDLLSSAILDDVEKKELVKLRSRIHILLS